MFAVQKRGAAAGMLRMSLGLCLGSAQIWALKISHKRTWDMQELDAITTPG